MSPRLKNNGYPSSQSDTKTCRSECQWPGCHFFAVTELRQSSVWGNPRAWLSLCTRHRSMFDATTFDELRALKWRVRRKRYI